MVVDITARKTGRNEIVKNNDSNCNKSRIHKSYIQIHGQWYDVTAFAPYHPGGDIIYEFIGRDATDVFTAFHLNHSSILRRMKKMDQSPPEQYIRESAAPNPTKTKSDLAFAKDMEGMIQKLHTDGLFRPSMLILTQKFLLTAFFFCLGVVSIFKATEKGRQHHDDSLLDWKLLIVAAMMIALFFQQCGFLMHDFMHNQWFQARKIDQALGRFFGSVCIGVNSLWWRDEHFVHHAFTNTYDNDVETYGKKRIIDVQLAQDLWAQDENLLQFFDGSLQSQERLLPFLPLSVTEKMIRAQAFLWLPLTVILGRINIIIASFLKYPNPTERVLQALHVAWFSAMLWASFPSVQSAALFHFLVSIGQGVLHVQLLVSHYVKPWNEMNDMKEPNCWYQKQILTTLNIAPLFSTRWLRRSWTQPSPLLDAWDDHYAPWLDDWFHGGLNLHIEHHTLPTLPRSSLREANRRMRRLCHKHDLHFDERHFLEVVWDTLVQLHQVGQKANFVEKQYAVKQL